MKVITSVVVLIAASVLALPLTAQASTTQFGTVAGHVRTEAGAPLRGIHVTIAGTTTVTDRNGRYSLLVRSGVREVIVDDLKQKYADEIIPNAVTVTRAKKVVFDEVLRPAASVSGQVVKSTGGPAPAVRVSAIPSDYRFGTISVVTTADGSYLLKGLSATEYRLQFVSENRQWDYLSDAQPAGTGSVVTLDYGEQLTGQIQTLIPASAITGKLYVNGVRAVTDLQGVSATLTDVATGVEVAHWFGSDSFKFRGIPAGDYRVSFAPASDDWIVPSYYGDTTDPALAQTIHVDPGQKLYGLSAQLTLAPIAHRLNTVIETSVNHVVRKGGTITLSAVVRSYGDPTGARVDLIWGGKVRKSSTVDADGRVTIRVAANDISGSRKKIKVYYQGTPTTERHPVYDYVKVK